MLSNASPPPGNMLGYSNAVLVLWLLQAPVGLGENTQLNVTVLARVNMQGHNPVPGYLLTQLPSLGAHDPERPPASQKPDWIVRGGNTTTTGDNMGDWAVNHTGDAWLAGGYYFHFHDQGKAAPTANGREVGIYGQPRYGCVYTSSDIYPEWETNRRHKAVPKYFATFKSPISGYVFLVGFTNYDWAKSQAAGYTGLVPPDVELCISYSQPPRWSAFAGDHDKIQTYFYEVFRADPDRTGNIYTTVNQIQDGDYIQDTRQLAPSMPHAQAWMQQYAAPTFQHPPLAPLPSQYHQVPATTAWSSVTTSNHSSFTVLLSPRYSGLPPPSTTSASSSEDWSQLDEEEVPLATPVTPPAPSAPPLTLEQLMEQLTMIAKSLPPDVANTLHENLMQQVETDEGESEQPFTPANTVESAQTSGTDTPPLDQASEDSLPRTRSGLPDWTSLWLRALQASGIAPGVPTMPPYT